MKVVKVVANPTDPFAGFFFSNISDLSMKGYNIISCACLKRQNLDILDKFMFIDNKAIM